MVTRKPIPDNASLESPMTTRPGPSDERRQMWPGTDGSSSPENIWGAEQSQHQPTPSPGRGSDGGSTSMATVISDPLQSGVTPPGPPSASQYSAFAAPSDENVWSDHTSMSLTADRTGGSAANLVAPDALRPGAHRAETNPFKRKPTPNSAAHSSDQPASTPLILTEPPTPPTAPFSQLNISNDASKNPWGPALDDKSPQQPPPQPLAATRLAEQDELGNDVWTSANVSADASRRPSDSNFTGSPSLISFPTEEDGSAAWDEVAAPPKPRAPVGATVVEEYEDRHAWDEVGGDKAKGKAPEQPPAASAQDLASSTGHGSDWNFVDHDPQPGQLSRRSTWEDFEDTPQKLRAENNAKNTMKELHETPQRAPAETLIDVSEGSHGEPQGQPGPPPPPRTSSAAAPSQPPRPVDGKAETYQIKNINWYDASASSNPRTSPILVQNENGPCPLVALVNALTLTTPAGVQTALVETLRSREQISLSFLLDAVFDELMSPRRLAEDTSLPDITELYSFLKGLHTGMNVNPRFVPTAEVIKAFKRTSLTHIHPTERSDNMIPGTFEDTMEMRLYSTFSVPLIHGWLPPPGDMAYDAFARRAESYEDAQNLLFREEELEDRLMSGGGHGQEGEGLTEEEQGIYQDILTIKSFLAESGTQLTRHGLEVITAAMKPGAVAILFRNDHFSTLYRHPQTLSLLTLVTDAGYASHAEVVWESLPDTTGENAEFFSGDFRVVGGATQHQQETMGRPPQQHQRSVSEGGDRWTAVTGRRDRGNGGGSSAIGPTMSPNDGPPLSPSSEQEDRDLALAMQLQEEEDEQHRAEQARRQRERQLSEQFIEQQARRNSAASTSPVGGAGNDGAFTGGGLVSQIPNARRGSSAAGQAPITSPGNQGRRVHSVSGSGGGGNGRGNAASERTQVRPLLTPVAATQRAADAGEDAPPPSYEQASRQQAYIPPEGHPSHPASSPRGSTASASIAASSPRASNTGMRQRGAVAGTGPSSLHYPGARPMRQGVPPASGNAGRDRDCVVM
ncbi:hypothetical protein RB597_006003 [Gaeumannomyces tritici]